MLILSRKVDEVLVIETPAGKKIEIIALGVKGHQVTLGTAASKDISIVRKELLDR